MQPPTSPQSPGSHGWYPDPWDRSRWRWWDGWSWTTHVSARPKKPVLPGWMSVPVLLASVPLVPGLILFVATVPLAGALALVPLLLVLPVMLWLDRVEPEPPSALVHAFLWGATVAVLVSATVNATVGAMFGENAAVLISAPLIEEATKAGGILYAVRRRDLDGPMDGIVYAGWTAIGFAVVEDVEYFARAMETGDLAAVFVLRGLLAPFAHPLFTAWTGLAVGRAVVRGKSVFPAILWGYALAVLSHALWNGSATAARFLGGLGLGILAWTVLAFVTLFLIFAVTLYRTRRKEERRFCELIPWLAERYGLAAGEVALFGDFKTMLRQRKRLGKAQRKWFDRVHTALARLVLLHDRPGGVDPGTEQAMRAQLQRARYGADD